MFSLYVIIPLGSPQPVSPRVMDHCGLGVLDLLWGIKGETMSLAGAQQRGEIGSLQGSKQWSGDPLLILERLDQEVTSNEKDIVGDLAKGSL